MSIYKTYNYLERCYENFFEILLNILNQVLNCGFVSAIVINKEIFFMCPIKTNFPSSNENTMVPNLHSSKNLNTRVSKDIIDINRILEKGEKNEGVIT